MIDGLIKKNRKDIKVLDNSVTAFNHLNDQSLLGVGSLGTTYEIKQRIQDSKDAKMNDAFSADQMSLRGLSWNIAFLDEVMRKEAYIINAINWKAIKALSNGIDLNIRSEDTEIDIHTTTKINDYIEKNFKKPLIDFLTQGEMYGGAGLLIQINGKNNDYSKPLTWKDVEYGDKINLRPLTRLYQIQPIITGNNAVWIQELGSDVGIYDSTELGKPLWWRVSINGSFFNNTNGKYSFDNHNETGITTTENMYNENGVSNNFVNSQIVHRSRIGIFNSSELNWIERNVEQYFGVSIIVKALESIKRYKQALDEIMSLLKRSNIPVLNANIKSAGSRNSNTYLKEVENTILSYYYALENGGLIVLGDKDKENLQFIQAEFRELTNILLDRKKELSADLQAPVSVTFNEEPKIDEHISYYGVHTMQERQLRPLYEQLIPLAYMAVTEGATKPLENFTFTFKSLEYISEKDKAEQQHKMGVLTKDLYDSDVIDRYEARKILISSADNVSDIFKDLKLDDRDKNVYASDIKIRVAEALNQSKFNPEKDNGKIYNPSQAGIAGDVLGGNQIRSKIKGIDIK